jgi:uncharacterized alkaline shock family protein YloU
VLESYGVTALADADLGGRLRRWLGLGSSGVRVDLRDGIAVELFLTVAYGVPVAEVVRQVESAVRYALRRALGRELDALVVHVGGLDYRRSAPPAPPPPSPVQRADAGPLLGDDAATGPTAEGREAEASMSTEAAQSTEPAETAGGTGSSAKAAPHASDDRAREGAQ